MSRAEVVQMAELIATAVEIDEHAFHHDAALSASLRAHRPFAGSRNGATSVQEHAQLSEQVGKSPPVARAVARPSIPSFELLALEHLYDSLACLAPFPLSPSHRWSSFRLAERLA